MAVNIPIENSQAVFGRNECIYKSVLDDFGNAEFIGVMTYNISPKTDSILLKALKEACIAGTKSVVFTNIPKRFETYYSARYAWAARETINQYKRQLNPENYGMNLSPYFVFTNHAKVIMTNNVVYWGSSNFSDESFQNIECGSISSDPKMIKYLMERLFPYIQKNSVPYYKHNFAIAIVNLESLIPMCKLARQRLFDAAFDVWSDYETGFKDKWVYRTTDSGITTKFLRDFEDSFSCFDDALCVIDDIIKEYQRLDELPNQVVILQGISEEYKETYCQFSDSILTLFEGLESVASYDVGDKACEMIYDDYGMEAYDEYLDYYAEKAVSRASEEYEKLITESEGTVREALKCLDSMIHYFEELDAKLRQLLEVNPIIDNTGA